MAKPNLTEQLTAFFQQQPPEQVAQWLAQTIAADKALKKQWQAKLLLASGKPGDYKKLLTKALPKKELLHTPNLWRKVGIYFDDAEALFALAFEQLDQGDCPLDNEQQFSWLMQAFERLNNVLEAIDDSGGYRLQLVEQLSTRLVVCFHQLAWPLEQKVNWLHEYRFQYEVFPYIPEQFDLPEDLNTAFERQHSEHTRSAPANLSDKVSMALLERLNARNKK